jgi:hypothetical protein
VPKSLRDKLIENGWVTSFNADSLVGLIERHYAALATPEPITEFVQQCRPLGDETLAVLTPEVRWALYTESDAQEEFDAQKTAPEPGPSDEELLSTFDAAWREDLPTVPLLDRPDARCIAGLRAVLARYGLPLPEVDS